MADQNAAATEGTNGTAVADVNGTADRAKMTRDQQNAADREAFLSGAWESDDEEPAKSSDKKPAPKSKPAEADVDDVDRDDDEADDEEPETKAALDEDEDEDEDDEDEDEAEAGDEDDEKPADAETAKRLDVVRRAEKRSRDRVAADAAAREKDFEKQRTAFVDEWKPKVEAAEKFEKLRAGASPYRAAEILLELGLSREDLVEAARDVYAASSKGAEDPKNKEAVAKSRRERELSDKLSNVEKKLEEREAAEKKQAEQQAVADGTRKFLARTAKAIGDESPLKRIKNPERLQTKLAEASIQLHEKLGEMPSAARIVKRAERLYLRELEDMGIEVDAIAKAPTPKAGAKPAAKKPAIQVVDRTKAAADTTDKKSGPVVIPTRADMLERLAKIQRGELDPDAD